MVIAGNHRVADLERPLINNHGRDHAASTVKLGFYDSTARQLIGIAPQLQNLGLKENHFHQFFHALTGLGGDLDENRAAAPLFRHQVSSGELLTNSVRSSSRFVDLVDRNDDRNS